MPSRFTVVKRLEDKQKEVENKLRKDLQNSPYAAITHDGWTSLNTESFYTTTIHFVDNEWTLKNAVLGTVKLTGTHTAENIADELQKTQIKWSIPQPVATTDNAANEQKAYSLLGWERFGCYGHRINLVVKNSLGNSEVAKILGKVRRLVTFFHKSSSLTDEIHVKQKLLFPSNQVGHKLIIDVQTRWNSTLQMLRRLLEQAPVLMALANDTTLTKAATTTLKKHCVFV